MSLKFGHLDFEFVSDFGFSNASNLFNSLYAGLGLRKLFQVTSGRL